MSPILSISIQLLPREFPIKSNTKYFTKSVCVLLCWHKKQKQELVLSWSSYGSFCSPICPLLPQIQVNAKANFLSKEIGSSHALLPAETKIWKSKQTDFKANKKGLFLGPFIPFCFKQEFPAIRNMLCLLSIHRTLPKSIRYRLKNLRNF